MCMCVCMCEGERTCAMSGWAEEGTGVCSVSSAGGGLCRPPFPGAEGLAGLGSQEEGDGSAPSPCNWWPSGLPWGLDQGPL